MYSNYSSRFQYAGILLLMSLTCLPVSANESDISHELVYPKHHQNLDYILELLTMALETSGKHYKLVPSTVDFPQKRALVALAKGEILNVFWSTTTIQREQILQPIRIPIYKGLFGWRIGLIHERKISLFNQITDSRQLKSLVIGQKHDWPDLDILVSNGFHVYSASDHNGLFQMLIKDRFDYFSRAAHEIWQEADKYKQTGLIVEQNILLYYPMAYYFFVNKDQQELADDIENGLEKLISDGRFEQHFQRYHAKALEQVQIDDRRIFRLTNPLLPGNTPLSRKELWLTP